MNIRAFINRNWYQITLIGVIILLPALSVWLFGFYHKHQIGPEQPIAFSHRVHVNEKEISCFFCHEGAMTTAHAGVPPLATCMLCHDRVIIHHPEIEKLHAHYNSGEPVEWVKVNDLPDHAFFNHALHVNRQIDCAECHGNVREMDRIKPVKEFKMDMCIDCHRQEDVTTDCFTCHR